MSISRRHFLRTGAIVCAAAGAPMSLSALAAEERSLGNGHAQPTGTTPALMSKAAFAPHLNTVFSICLPDGQEISAELIALRDTGPARQQKATARAARECFALAFRTTAQPPLVQNTYRLEHRALGRFDLFIGPVPSKKRGQVYEAIINHQRA
jgi:Domain of unknown function (DUF6916)